MFNFVINNDVRSVEDCYKGRRLIDFLRDDLGLVGTKEGCGEGECGACTVLIGEFNNDNVFYYRSCAACLMLVGEMSGKHIVTIEGVQERDSSGNINLNLIQKVMVDALAIQCGFCTPGFIMSLSGYLLKTKDFRFKTMLDALDGNICRCTGYVSIKRAMKKLVEKLQDDFDNNDIKNRVKYLVKKCILPEYFLSIEDKLRNIKGKDYCICGENFSNRSDSILVAGGTDVCIQKADVLSNTENLFFISNMKDISDSIYVKDDQIIVGARVKVEDFRTSEIIGKYFPTIKDDLLFFASTILRNNATLIGNLVNASPIGDLSTILLALNVIIVARKISCENCNCNEDSKIRDISIKKFFKDYKITDLKDNEIITEIKIPIKKNSKFNFEKVSTRKYLDIASCSSAICIQTNEDIITNVSISSGGVDSVPIRLDGLERFLNGKKICKNTIYDGLNIVDSEINPRGSILRGTSEYKKELLKQLIKVHFNKLFPDKFNIEVK